MTTSKKNSVAAVIAANLKQKVQEINTLRAQCTTRGDASADTGHEVPVCPNSKWLLNMLMQTMENTLRRPRPGFRSAEQSYHETKERLVALQERYGKDQDGLLIDPSFNYLGSWHLYNEAVVEFFADMQKELGSVFAELYGTPWEP